MTNSILSSAPGSGYGKPIINALREYADRSRKSFQVLEIENEAFFDHFSFWTDRFYADEDGAGEAIYDPV
jgi:hypothetical protein